MMRRAETEAVISTGDILLTSNAHENQNDLVSKKKSQKHFEKLTRFTFNHAMQ